MDKAPYRDDSVIRDSAECERYKTNHILHLLLSIITVGAWTLIWTIISASNTTERNKIHRKYSTQPEGNPAALLLVGILILVVTIVAYM